MAPKLELLHEGKTMTLRVDEVVLGRTADCALHVIHPLVSRRHCRIVLTPGGVQVQDLGSSNGTFLSDRKINQTTRAFVGDVVRVGQEGPAFQIVSAELDGVDIATDLADANVKTLIVGDPRAEGVVARVAVGPGASERLEEPRTKEAEPPTREAPRRDIPVATPLDALSSGDRTGTVINERNDGSVEPSAPRAASPVVPDAPTAEIAVDDGGYRRGLLIGAAIGFGIIVLLGLSTPLGERLHRLAPALRLVDLGGGGDAE